MKSPNLEIPSLSSAIKMYNLLSKSVLSSSSSQVTQPTTYDKNNSSKSEVMLKRFNDYVKISTAGLSSVSSDCPGGINADSCSDLGYCNDNFIKYLSTPTSLIAVNLALNGKLNMLGYVLKYNDDDADDLKEVVERCLEVINWDGVDYEFSNCPCFRDVLSKLIERNESVKHKLLEVRRVDVASLISDNAGEGWRVLKDCDAIEDRVNDTECLRKKDRFRFVVEKVLEGCQAGKSIESIFAFLFDFVLPMGPQPTDPIGKKMLEQELTTYFINFGGLEKISHQVSPYLISQLGADAYGRIARDVVRGRIASDDVSSPLRSCVCVCVFVCIVGCVR